MLRRIVYPSFVVLLPFLMYIQSWHGPKDQRAFFVGDPEDSYHPDLRVLEQALFSGELPLWNPYDRAGYPFAADPQPGVLYPLNWLLAVIGHCMGGVTLGLTEFKLILHLSIAGLCMYLFMRDREQPEPAAATAALSYQFGAFFASQMVFSLTWPLAWTPLLLRNLDRLFARPTAWRAVSAAGVMGLIINAGSPPAVYYGTLIALPYFALRLVESLKAAPLKLWLSTTGVQLALAGGLGALLSMPQILAALVITKHSVRENASFELVSSGSVFPEGLLGLAVKAIDGNHYQGICALFFAALGALYYRERKEVAAFVAVIVFGLLMMMGMHTQFFRVAYDLLPGVDRFRFAYRYCALVSFGVSVLASYGVTALLERRVSERALRAAGVGGLVLLAMGLYLTVVRVEDGRYLLVVRDIVTIGLLLVIAVALAHGLHRQTTHRAGLCICLLGVVALDYGIYVPRVPQMHAAMPPDLGALTPEETDKLRHDVRGYRVYSEFALRTFRPGSLQRFRDLRGYFDPLLLRDYNTVMFDQLKWHPAEIMALYNVKYYLFSSHPHLQLAHHFVSRPDEVAGFTRITPKVYEVKDPAPDAYWVGQIDLQPDKPAVLQRLHTVDHHQSALVARDELEAEQAAWADKLPKSAHRSVAARVLERGYNYLTLAANAPAEGLLVVNEAWFPGWSARVDGESVPLMKVNYLMQGLRLAPGSHRVELRFRPAYFLVPLALALLSLLAVAAGFARAYLRRRHAG